MTDRGKHEVYDRLLTGTQVQDRKTRARTRRKHPALPRCAGDSRPHPACGVANQDRTAARQDRQAASEDESVGADSILTNGQFSVGVNSP